MGHSPGFYRRFIVLALQTEVVRGGLCAILLVVLLVSGAPFWLALAIPFLAYFGLARLAPIVSRIFDARPPRAPLRTPDEAYATCLSLQRKFQVLASRAEGNEIAEQLRRIAGWIARILQTIVEDDKNQASLTLINLTETTDDFLTAYLKVSRRGLDGSDVQERVRVNLASLESAYARFYERLNRDAVVDLEALSDTIEFNLTELGTLRQLGEIS
jgi:hypothetical protein